MKSIATRYGYPLSASDLRAPATDCSSGSVSVLTASVSLKNSRSRGWLLFSIQQLYLELRLHVDPVVVLRSPAIDVLLPVLAHHDDWRGVGRLERKSEDLMTVAIASTRASGAACFTV